MKEKPRKKKGDSVDDDEPDELYDDGYRDLPTVGVIKSKFPKTKIKCVVCAYVEQFLTMQYSAQTGTCLAIPGEADTQCLPYIFVYPREDRTY